MHFVSCVQLGEPKINPAPHYHNNVSGAQTLLDFVITAGVPAFVFSSSTAAYGAPEATPIPESHPKRPSSPYGRSKWELELMLEDYTRAYGLNSASLSHFNVGGALPSGGLYEMHENDAHLVPPALQAASGLRRKITLSGTDYEPPEGASIRDYAHVLYLCQAHLQAMEQPWAEGGCHVYSIGNGIGYSDRDVLSAVSRVTGNPLIAGRADRRPSDAARVVADPTHAQDRLGWRPAYPDLEILIDHAWAAMRWTHAPASLY